MEYIIIMYCDILATYRYNFFKKNLKIYSDDALIKCRLLNEHIEDLKEMFNTLRWFNMKLNLLKCIFGVGSGKFLGYLLTLDKIKTILEMMYP